MKLKKCEHKKTETIKCNNPICLKYEHCRCLSCGIFVDEIKKRRQ